MKRTGETKAGPLLTGSMEGIPIVLCHLGMGPRSAAETGKQIVEQFHPSLLICSGYAGGLSNELQIGDVVFDARGTPFTAPQITPLRSVAGRIVASDSAAETPEAKLAMHRETGALAVDMESAAIAEICTRAGIPMVSLRAISDSAQDALPVPMEHWFDLDRQRPRALGLLRYLAGNPKQIGPFIRFLRGLPKARAALTRALLVFIAEVSRSHSARS